VARTFLSVKLPLRHDDGGVYALCGVATDITERKHSEEQLRLAASVFQHAQEGIMITDAEGHILDVNPAFTTLTGYARDEVLGRNPSLLQSDRHAPEFFQHMWSTLNESGSWRGEVWNRKKNGELFAELLAITAVPSVADAPGYFVGVFSDITQLKAHQQHLERIAHFDALTQLPNRVLLADRLHVALARARRSGELLAVCYLDLDEFKPVNDTYGHERGDRLLVEIASRLTLGLRAGDTVARLGGDEFVLLLGGLRDVGECQVTLERLLRLVATPCVIEGTAITLSASIGVALYPQDNTDPDTLLRHADQSMYVAKEQGRNRFHVYDPEQDRRARAMRDALARMEQALVDEEFQLYYQPKVDLRRGQVIGAEALIRWRHPERGLLPPSEFLPLIEETALAPRVGEWVIDRALGQMATWRAQGLIIPVSVNVSARHLLAPNFVDKLAESMSRHDTVPPRDLELEILETSALDDLVHVTNLINACREHGVSFALDDFGTGYSSLSYLKRLPAETLKIDQSFVRDMLRDSEDMAITGGIIGLADAFQRRVIAEGVEEIEHGVLLLLLGCDLAQGYAISRPMPASDFPDWVAGWRPSDNWVRAAACRASKQDLPVVLAMRDHRRWVASIASWIDQDEQGEARQPPLSVNSCRFSHWHDGHGMSRYGNWHEFLAIAPLHDQLHAHAEELAALRASGQIDTARERLESIKDLSDRLVAALELLWARICA
jgi:diguanylate cyclase (GGDEF)-like protein/PAS domain S-box-containing protein